MYRIKDTLIFLSCLFFMNGFAQELTKKVGVGGAIGINYPNNTNSFKDNNYEELLYQLHLKYHYNENLASLLEVSHETFNKNVSSATLEGFQTLVAGAQYRFGNVMSKWFTAVKLGVGLTQIKDSQENKNRFSAKTGLSVGYFLTPSLLVDLAFDYKFIEAYSTNRTEYKTFTPMLELTYYFGEKTINEAMPKFANAVSVSDGDADADGIKDSKDKCPNTPEGAKINSLGCEAKQKAELKLNILFLSKSNLIDPTYHEELNKVAQVLNDHPKAKVMIEGHTDSNGNAILNQTLSEARALAVKSYLVEKLSVDAAKISTVGFGSQQPVASNSTAEGRANNRRVIAVFQE